MLLLRLESSLHKHLFFIQSRASSIQYQTIYHSNCNHRNNLERNPCLAVEPSRAKQGSCYDGFLYLLGTLV